jgi:hypothetical protein
VWVGVLGEISARGTIGTDPTSLLTGQLDGGQQLAPHRYVDVVLLFQVLCVVKGVCVCAGVGRG